MAEVNEPQNQQTTASEPKTNTADLEAKVAQLEALVAAQKQSISKANSESADYKRKYQATLNEQQKAEEERAAHETEREELLKSLLAERATRNNSKGFAESLGVEASIADELSKYFDGELKPEFFGALKKWKADFDKEQNILDKKNTPRPIGANATYTSVDDILKIADAAERQRVIAENIDLFR